MPIADLSNYKGREQAYVKHWLLEKYLAPLTYKVGSAWDSLVYIDGFAGPWEVSDPKFTDSSFGIAVETLKRAQAGLREKGRRIRIEIILVEENREAFSKLKIYAESQNVADFNVTALRGEFVDKIPEIDQIVGARCKNPFRFVFLDPKGWAAIPMRKLQAFLKDRSCEVLINLMTRHIIRFLKEDDRADSYQNLFGRQRVLEKLRQTPKADNEQTEQAVREYCRSLKDLCNFHYVSSAAVLEPDRESVKYFLVYGTNNVHGVEVFKQAEIAAARIQDEIRHETKVQKTGQEELHFEQEPPKSRVALVLRERYLKRARTKILETLKSLGEGRMITYAELFCIAMSFPLVTPDDLIAWLEFWRPNVELRLVGTSNRRKPSADQADQVAVIVSNKIV